MPSNCIITHWCSRIGAVLQTICQPSVLFALVHLYNCSTWLLHSAFMCEGRGLRSDASTSSASRTFGGAAARRSGFSLYCHYSCLFLFFWVLSCHSVACLTPVTGLPAVPPRPFPSPRHLALGLGLLALLTRPRRHRRAALRSVRLS